MFVGLGLGSGTETPIGPGPARVLSAAAYNVVLRLFRDLVFYRLTPVVFRIRHGPPMPPCFSGSILVFCSSPAPPSLFFVCPGAYLICPWDLSGVRSSPCGGDFGRSFCWSVMCGSCGDSNPDDVRSSSKSKHLAAPGTPAVCYADGIPKLWSATSSSLPQ